MTRKLDRLNPSNSTGIAFQRLWQKTCENIEASLDDLQTQLTAIQAAQAAADAAQGTADTAQTTASAAQGTADTVTRNDAISASATAPSTILSASDAGADATVTIAAHNRIYGDGLVRAITAGSITGLAYSTEYAVYYDDTGRTAGAKTFVATTTLKDAQYNSAPGRHFCGQVTTPAAGGGGTSGGPGIPGGGGPYP